MKDLSRLELNDLVEDHSFVHYVHQTDAGAHAYWEHVIAQHPDRREVFDAATLIVRGVRFRHSSLPAEEVASEWQRLETAIDHTGNRRRIGHTYRWAAAAVVLICAAFILLYRWQLPDVEETTAYGEIREVTLPDGSTATLNANSSLAYNNWAGDAPREVWLTGEAFFDVTKQPGRADGRFIVYSQGTQVEVLGTRFDVNNRRGETTVVLNSGKVVVKKTGRDTTRVTMKPGDLVTLSPAAKQPLRKRVNPNLYSSWKERKFIFDNTPLPEVAALIRENYGVEVLIKDASLHSKVLSGEITVPNMDVLLRALAPFGIKITRRDNRIIMEEKL